MKKDILQSIYDDTFKLCYGLTKETYNSLPEVAPYPFIYVGEQFDQPKRTKDPYITAGSSQLTVHIYGLKKKRRAMTDLMRKVRLSLPQTDNNIHQFENVNTVIQEENSNKTESLVHGVLTVDFSYLQDERGN